MASFFVNRPIVAMVLSILMVLLGAVAMQSLPISQYPEITPPEILVEATYTGASAVDVEQSVATPVEQQVNGVENMIYMKSTNAADGKMQLRVSFDVGTDLDIANVLTQNRVSQANPSLPEEVKRLGVSVKKSLAFPLLLVTLTSPKGSYDSGFLSNYASINIIDAIARTRGVGLVNQFGGSDYAMRIWIRPDRLAQLSLTIPDIQKAIQQQSVIAAAGQIGGPPAPKGTDFTYTVKTAGRLETPEEFGEVVLRSNPDGSQVRLKDVARIELGAQIYSMIGRLNGKPAAVLAIYQIPGSNALEVAGTIRKTMAELSQRFPEDLEYEISLDTTLSVTEGINEILQTLFEAVVLVLLVVFVFLQNWRATLIPLLTVPVSLVATFIVFPMLGFSINTLSLLGLVLAIGIVVDDAIVVVEAVMHHVEQGMSPKDATLQAMKEVSGPVVAIALVLSAVFVPVAFVSGITGRLYQQFAITIAISVLFSALNALTLSPALSAKLIKPKGESKSFLDPFYRGFNKVFDAITNGYIAVTRRLVTNLPLALGLVAALIVGTVFLARAIPGGFVPEEDQGYFLINVQLPEAASQQRTDAICRQAEKILGETGGIESYTTVVGYSLLSSSSSSDNAFFFVSLKEWGERGKEEHVFRLIRTLNARFAREIPGALVYAFGPPAIPGLGTGSGFSIMVQDQAGGTPAYLEDQVQKFIAEARKRPEIGNAFTTYSARVPQIFADIDREKVLKLGVQLADVNTTLGASLGGSYINDFNRFGRLYKVYAQAEPEYRAKADTLGQYFVRNAEGGMVPLSTVVDFQPLSGPTYTNRFNLFRAAEITGTPAPGNSSSQAIEALKSVANETLPTGMGYAWNAMSFQEVAAAGTAAVVFVFALVVVFLILAAQYESWSLPFSVLLGTPFAAFGAFFGLWAARFSSESYVNNVFAQIGLVMLIGLAAKNAILIVEFARAKLHEGMPLVEAALLGARLRFRPILMTAFAFILGVVPLVRASGAGAEARKVMGMAVFSGMLIATIVGVFLVPALFVAVERLTGGKRPAPAPGGAPPEGAHGAAPAHGGGH
jgi:HAE1 family hydrophobic/amphiphilic exporter-1